MSYRIEDLSKNCHQYDDFDCGRGEQNRFLKNRAWNHYQDRYSKTYVLVEQDRPEVYGFYSLSMGRVEFENAPPEYKENEYLPDYPVPTVLIGQMGVDESIQGNGYGEFLLTRALAVASVTSRESVGAAAVEVHADTEESRAFFGRYGFVQMQDDDERHMFMGMSKADKVAGQIEATQIPTRLGN